MAEAEVKELDKREEKADDITRAGDDRVEEERGRDQQRTKKKHRDHSESSSSSKSSLSDRSRSRRKNKKDDDEKISKKKKSYSRSRSPYDRRRRSSDRRNKYRSRSRSNSRDRRRNDRRYRGRSDSRSPPRKNYKNDSRRRSRSRSYSPKRNTRKNNNRSPSLSPISRRQKLREERIKAQANQLPNKFWDGFQWVERTPAVTGSTMQAVVEAINSSTSSNAPPTVGTSLPTPAISLAQQKDRRIYLGNLPPDVTPEFLKDFSKFSFFSSS